MSSVLRTVKKRKKGRTLGGVDVIDRAAYAELEVDAKVELIRSLVPLGLMHIEELLDEEVTALAGERYARKDPSVAGRRHGSNPGTVGLAGQRVPIRVPRLRHVAGSEIPLRSYEADTMVQRRRQRLVAEARAVRDLVAGETTNRPPRRFPGRSACRGRTWMSRAVLFRPSRSTKLRRALPRRSAERDSTGRTVVGACVAGLSAATFAEDGQMVVKRWAITPDARTNGFLGVRRDGHGRPEKVLTLRSSGTWSSSRSPRGC